MAMGSGGREIRRYRLGVGALVSISLFLGLPGVPLVASIAFAGGMPIALRVGLLLFISTVYVGIAAFWRAATTVYEDHIAVRTLLRTRRTAWADVVFLDGESERYPCRALLLDRDGRLSALPQVGTQHDRVRHVRDVWERFRGEGWTPPTDAFIRAAQRRDQARSSALVWAIMLTVGSILAILAAVFLVVGLTSAGDSESVAWPFQVLVFVPLAVFFATHRIVGRLRRRRIAAETP